ncbi:MAG: hypothetical protein ACP5HM_08650 [Anaerolineae bacterium]
MNLKRNLAREVVRSAEPEELRAWLDELLPVVIQQLSKEERVALVKSLLHEHLGTLLHDLNTDERTALLEDLLPLLLKEFSLQDLDLLKLFADL